jgi:uncharacterized protein (DUF427 family)
MSEQAPGFIKHPGYRVDIAQTRDHVRILAGGHCLADSRSPLKVTETRHRPVWYLPLADLDANAIERTDHQTYCPFKGHASYWTVKVPGARLENSVWGYLEPYRECEQLKDHVGFYTDRFTLEVNGERVAEEGPGWTE